MRRLAITHLFQAALWLALLTAPTQAHADGVWSWLCARLAFASDRASEPPIRSAEELLSRHRELFPAGKLDAWSTAIIEQGKAEIVIGGERGGVTKVPVPPSLRDVVRARLGYLPDSVIVKQYPHGGLATLDSFHRVLVQMADFYNQGRGVGLVGANIGHTVLSGANIYTIPPEGPQTRFVVMENYNDPKSPYGQKVMGTNANDLKWVPQMVLDAADLIWLRERILAVSADHPDGHLKNIMVRMSKHDGKAALPADSSQVRVIKVGLYTCTLEVAAIDVNGHYPSERVIRELQTMPKDLAYSSPAAQWRMPVKRRILNKTLKLTDSDK